METGVLLRNPIRILWAWWFGLGNHSEEFAWLPCSSFQEHVPKIASQLRFGSLKKLFKFLRGPEKGQDKGLNIWQKNTSFWHFMTSKIEFLTKYTLLGILSCPKIWTCTFFPEKKKPLREQPQAKNCFKNIFREFGMSKVLGMFRFWQKKRLRHARTDKHSF